MLSLAEKGGTLQIDLDALESTASTLSTSNSKSIIGTWGKLLGSLPTLPVEKQLVQVNHFFHRHVTYREDIHVWGKSDYWATPLQTLMRGEGDCEDYSIAKYVSLLEAGIPNERLRLIYVRARIGGPASPVTRPHMVLAYYESPGAEPLILDSLTRDVLPASERTDLFPVFSFNSESLWVGGNRATSNSPTSRLSHWRDVIERMNEEGIRWKNH
jgi:predicted transglutaminase-like cysteine proteinase